MKDKNIVCSRQNTVQYAVGGRQIVRGNIFAACCLLLTAYFAFGCAASQRQGYIQKKDNIIHDKSRIQIDEEKKKKAESLFNNGFKLINNDPISANALYREGITLMPERWEAYYNLGITYLKLYDHERAIKEFSNSLKYNAPPSKVYNAIGITYQYMGRNADAIKYFKKALSAERSPVILINIANIYQNMGQADEAIKFYHQIEPQDIPNLPLYTNMGILRYKKGDYKAAIDEFDKALIKEGENIKLLYYQAQTYLKLGEYENALNIYQKIASKNPSDPEPYKNIGIIYEIYLGDMAGAYKNYTEYLKNGGEKTKDMESWIEVVKAKAKERENH
jgi:tetratricopeptide (TPR) repeat protein